jgi:hypothetical protein
VTRVSRSSKKRSNGALGDEETMIIGPDVPDQAMLRPERPIGDLGEFIAFLRRIESIFGSLETPRRPTVGDHFLL